MRAIYMNRKVDGQTHRRVDERTHNKWEDGQTLSMQGCTPTMIPFPYTFPFLLRACKWWYKVNHMSCVSLVPRPSHRPVFDWWQCAHWRWNVWVHFNDFNVYQCTQWGEGVLTEQMSLRLTCSLPLSARVLIQNIREAENFLHIVKGEDVCAKQALSLGNPFSHST